MENEGEHEGETVAAIFARYQRSPTGQLRIDQAAQNLVVLHDLERPLRILDAGGGNGRNTDWLLRRGHDVTLVDPDPEMLVHARQRLERRDDRCGELELVHGSIESAADLLADRRFDLVVCHHVLEYVPDPRRALTELRALTDTGGELSLVTLNPISEVIRAIVFRKDAALALSRTTDLDYDAKWFGAARLYELEQIVEWGAEVGWHLEGFRGIRVLADYIPEVEYSEATVRDVRALEETLAGRDPYRRFGRYLQLAFTTEPS